MISVVEASNLFSHSDIAVEHRNLQIARNIISRAKCIAGCDGIVTPEGIMDTIINDARFIMGYQLSDSDIKPFETVIEKFKSAINKVSIHKASATITIGENASIVDFTRAVRNYFYHLRTPLALMGYRIELTSGTVKFMACVKKSDQTNNMSSSQMRTKIRHLTAIHNTMKALQKEKPAAVRYALQKALTLRGVDGSPVAKRVHTLFKLYGLYSMHSIVMQNNKESGISGFVFDTEIATDTEYNNLVRVVEIVKACTGLDFSVTRQSRGYHGHVYCNDPKQEHKAPESTSDSDCMAALTNASTELERLSKAVTDAKTAHDKFLTDVYRPAYDAVVRLMDPEHKN